MKITLLKPKGMKETMSRVELHKAVKDIASGTYVDEVHRLRELYPLVHPKKDAEGRIMSNYKLKLALPRLCFAVEMKQRSGVRRILGYNGLLVLEANNLADYDEALRIRDEAARLPQTLLAFLGAGGRSVKIVCRGELFPDSQQKEPLPTDEEDIKRFHLNLYKTARKAYNAQLDLTLDALEPLLERTVYMSTDPDLKYDPQAVPFYVDCSEEPPAQKLGLHEGDFLMQHLLMPGKTVKQAYALNYQFIVTNVLGKWFELPDEERVSELLMQIAGCCMVEGIPMENALRLTLLHPVLNQDRLLVEKTFESAYAVKQMENYIKRNRLKPLRSVPEDTLMMKKTDIFLNTHYEMHKNGDHGVGSSDHFANF